MAAPAPVPHTPEEAQRRDIQALRGLAIGLVLLYHAQLAPALGAGHLGVDIFFVVSGFLITGVVQRGLVAGTFSFSAFYFRRAKRLLPAAYAVFLACALAAPWFLTQLEFRDFTWQLLGAVTFTGNIALWMQTGYFETAAELKPLLHVWSLSIEEQYYLLLPATLAFTPRRWWGPLALVITAGSLALCLLMAATKPGAVFYLLPTRAWELGLGSLGALLLGGAAWAPCWRVLFWPALATLLWIPFQPTGGAHPGIDALLVCCATLVVILRRHPVVNRGLPIRALAWIGDISYSLYLVHWPLLAFAANAWVSDVPMHVRASLAALSVVLAWALYRWVEDPIRRSRLRESPRRTSLIVGASAAMVAIGFFLRTLDHRESVVNFQEIRAANTGLDPTCETRGARHEGLSQCRVGSAPEVVVWGDSFAMHLVDGIQSTNLRGIIQVTKSLCGPVLGMSVFRDSGIFNRDWAIGCLLFNRDALGDIAKEQSVDVVVLASTSEQYIEGNRLLVEMADASTEPLQTSEANGTMDTAVAGFTKTVTALRAMGKRVILVAPPPASLYDIGRCLELRASDSLFFGADHQDCSLDIQNYGLRRGRTKELLRRIEREARVPIIDFDELLCNSDRCKVELEGIPLYRDRDHLSRDGSRILGERMRLAERIWAEAR